MADRLKAAIGAIALSALIACRAEPDTAPPAMSDVMALASKTVAAANGFERYYRAENDGVVDAYVERALGYRRATGRTEACRLPTGALGTRPTVLANPPLSSSAIRQRGALVAALGAYVSTLSAIAEGSSAATISASFIYAKSRAVALQQAASVHAQGDLFLTDEARELGRAVASIEPNAAKEVLVRQLVGADAIAHHLNTIAASDVARQRIDSIDATTLAYDTWLARTRRGSGASHLYEPPFCSEPAIFYRPALRDGALQNTDPVNPRGKRLRDRMNAVRRADPSAVLRAMAALQEAEMALLAGSREAAAATRADATRVRLERVSERFANASSALEPAAGARHSESGSR